ncbi:hypothetical protein H4R18_005584 [Coemansia javaensis]|uniref:Uncharacterized protein n=1 Tax=Coemansia javaensis TaxID=2761396 RepID=A0A9W8LD35_9FUNG|nr:hypothetical protein H4R18_005584 [Coemansia javaensis]
MKFGFATIAALLACASRAVADIDWAAADTYACALATWPAVKAAVDPSLKQSWAFVPPFMRQALLDAGAVSADGSLVAKPTPAQLAALGSGLPFGVFNPNADYVITSCLATYVPTSESSTSESSTSESSTSDSSSSSESSSSSSESSSSSSETTSSTSDTTSSTSESSSSTSETTSSTTDTSSTSSSTETSDYPVSSPPPPKCH